ncbi:MAG: YgeY family selenium metabolism-linked hydrolase [Spirochaetaceae bacterium]|nr:MAG: YgeY family selenium metabolism-linked hydrolase [Spirochaetaceae bacterium]
MKQLEQVRELSRKYADDTTAILSRLVQTRSFGGEEGAVLKVIEDYCRQYNFDEIRYDGLGNLLCRVGEGPKSIAIDAHVDTVHVGDPAQWTRDPFSGIVEEGWLHGRGSSDQKGGAASMITAGRILKELNYTGPYAVWFTFTIFEEDCDGMCWRYIIEEEKLVPDFAVSTEPTSCRLYRGHRGRMEMEVHFKGVSCHGSAPERGVNAAYKAARTILALEKLNENLQPDDDGFLGKGTVVVSQVKAHGPSQCAVPDLAQLYLDRRLTWGETKELAVQQVMDLGGGEIERVEVPFYTNTSWKGTTYGQELYFPTWKIPADHPLVQSGVEAYRGVFGKDPVVDKWTFSTNGVSICGMHKVPMIGFGPGDEDQAHAPNEKLRVADLPVAAGFYAALPYTLPD